MELQPESCTVVLGASYSVTATEAREEAWQGQLDSGSGNLVLSTG